MWEHTGGEKGHGTLIRIYSALHLPKALRVHNRRDRSEEPWHVGDGRNHQEVVILRKEKRKGGRQRLRLTPTLRPPIDGFSTKNEVHSGLLAFTLPSVIWQIFHLQQFISLRLRREVLPKSPFREYAS